MSKIIIVKVTLESAPYLYILFCNSPSSSRSLHDLQFVIKDNAVHIDCIFFRQNFSFQIVTYICAECQL